MGGRRAARCQSAAALRRRRAREKEGTSFPREGEALSALPLPAGLSALPGGIRRAGNRLRTAKPLDPRGGETAGGRLLARYRHLPPPRPCLAEGSAPPAARACTCVCRGPPLRGEARGKL